MQREMPSRVDYITNLPECIMETMLTKLPLRDVVRTSILSSKWRYKWATLTHLVFNDKCVSQTQDISLAKFISRFLLLHEGPINKFVLSNAKLKSSSDVDQWLLFLSRKDVKELVVNLGGGRWFKAPSCLFSCKKLVRLELSFCVLNPPLSFKGFPFLRQLNLQEVDIASNALENLISSCPVLETLNVWYCNNTLELAIRAPNLKYLILFMAGESGDICLENTPKLVTITVSMYIYGDVSEYFGQCSSCNFDTVLGGVPSLQKLIGRSYFVQYLSVGNNTFGKTEMKYQQLKVIELSEVDFEDTNEIKVVLRLILNAPNLQELHILGSSDDVSGLEAPDLDFWDKECLFDCTFERLKLVKMKDMFGIPHEVKFIGFLLGNSPLLETISITPSNYMTENKFSFLIELTRFQRASPKAEMIFIHS